MKTRFINIAVAAIAAAVAVTVNAPAAVAAVSNPTLSPPPSAMSHLTAARPTWTRSMLNARALAQATRAGMHDVTDPAHSAYVSSDDPILSTAVLTSLDTGQPIELRAA